MLHTLLGCLALLSPPATHSPLQAEEAKLLDRIVLIGASVTAGFGLNDELNANATLVEFLDAAITVPHEVKKNLGSMMLFSGPVDLGRKQIEKALAVEPTLVVAADFPFWFGYGHWSGPDGRLDALEKGLKLLEVIECPLIVGDFPDMSHAVRGSSPLMGGGPMVSRSQIPSAEELAKLNARVHEWVASREKTYLFEMSGFVQHLNDEATLELRGNSIDAKAKKALLQPCLLHPTVKGTCVFTVLLFDALVRQGVVPEDAVVWDLATLEAGVWKATEKVRERRLERERRREERMKELKEKKKREKENGGGGGGKEAPPLVGARG